MERWKDGKKQPISLPSFFMVHFHCTTKYCATHWYCKNIIDVFEYVQNAALVLLTKEVPMGKKIDLYKAIIKVREAVGSALGNSEKKFWDFMKTKQAGLDGLSPLDYLETNGKAGLHRVLDFVKGSKAGEMS